jgi:hypothetical protein
MKFTEATIASELLAEVFHQHSFGNKQMYGCVMSTHLRDLVSLPIMVGHSTSYAGCTEMTN